MDVVFFVIGIPTPPNSQLSIPNSNRSQGDVSNIHISTPAIIAPKVEDRVVHIHVTGAPDVPLQKWRELSTPWVNELEEPPGIYARHLWFFDMTVSSVEEIQALTVDRTLTRPWSRVKETLRNKETGNFITDGDLIG